MPQIGLKFGSPAVGRFSQERIARMFGSEGLMQKTPGGLYGSDATYVSGFVGARAQSFEFGMSWATKPVTPRSCQPDPKSAKKRTYSVEPAWQRSPP